MARATLEMLLKLTGADKTSRGLDKVSKATKEMDETVTRAEKSNAKFAAGMSGLTKAAIAGGALFAAKSLFDFSKSAINAASAAEEASAAFGATFKDSAEELGIELAKSANLFGLTESEAQQLISVFGSVAQGIGFTEKEAAALSLRVFKLSGDIASFNNLQQGALPVIAAFRSGIAGERESLATYGLKITEAMVQQKAFNLGLAKTVDELTLQDKALATIEIAYDQAGVQLGNAQREADGFAASSLMLNAELRELREEIGKELIPAAAALLPVIREIAQNVTPSLIRGFSLFATGVADLVLALDRLSSLDQGVMHLIRNFSDLADEQREINKIAKEQSDMWENYTGNIQTLNKHIERSRHSSLKQQVQYKKVADTIDRFLNPIFGEQNALLLTNMQLEMDRTKIMNLVTSANDDVAAATKNRNKAAKDLQELQIAENIADAQAAIRKNELTTQIGILTRAESDGKDVKAELALAQAELAEAEFELANDSDRLVLARDVLNLAETNLEKAIARRSKAIQDSRDMLVYENEALNKNTEAKKRNADATQRQIDLLRQFLAIERSGGGGFAPPPATGGGSPPPVPPPLVGDESLVSSPRSKSGNGNGETVVKIELSDTAEEFLQTTQEKLTKLGYALQ
jgi:hypothetical protein